MHHLKYMGSIIQSKHPTRDEVKLCANLASRTYLWLRKILWFRSKVSCHTKLLIQRTPVRSMNRYT